MDNRYSELTRRSDVLDETNDCSVKALAVVADLNYEQAHRVMTYYSRRRGKGTYFTQHTRPALYSLGFECVPISPRHRLAKCKTMRTLGRNLPSRGVFLVQVRRHIVGCRAGKIHDSIYQTKRLTRIQSVWRIVKRDTILRHEVHKAKFLSRVEWQETFVRPFERCEVKITRVRKIKRRRSPMQ